MGARQERLVYDLRGLEEEVRSVGFPLTVRTLREHIKRGELKAKKVGRAYVVTKRALMDFVGEARG